jgi:hypothetical protein
MLEESGLKEPEIPFFFRPIRKLNLILIHISFGQADESCEYYYKTKLLISMLHGRADSTAATV